MAGLRAGYRLAALAILCMVSCSSPVRPPSRPATRIYDRSMAQLGMVELVVADRTRAERAKALFERIERAFVNAEATRLAASQRALGLSEKGEPTDDEIRAAFKAMDAAASQAFARYVSIQIELRQVLTRGEFDKLSKVR